MKTKINMAAIIIAALQVFIPQAIFAQGQSIPQKFSLHLVTDRTGHEQIIDKTFTSPEEMDAFIKENGHDLPELAGGNPHRVIKREVKVICKREGIEPTACLSGPSEGHINDESQRASVDNPQAGNEANLNDMDVYPNPNHGVFHVAFNVTEPGNVSLKIMDEQGKVIYSRAQNNYSGKFEKEIDVSTFANGIYIVEAKVNDEVRTTRIIKQE